MGNLLFSQACMVKLVEIKRNLERDLGYKFKLLDTDDLVDLLMAAALSSDKNIRHSYLDFLKRLDQNQLDELGHLGLDLPDE